MARKAKQKSLKKVYLDENAKIGDLILFSMFSLEKDGKKCAFENIMKKCFELFPVTFRFSRKFTWPDSRKIDRPLRSLREQDLIKGNPKNSFSLTKKGKATIQETIKRARQTKLL